MWRILNRFFGWQYVHMKNSADEIIRRVRWTASGEPFVRYFSSHLVFIARDRREHGWMVTALTTPKTQSVDIVHVQDAAHD